MDASVSQSLSSKKPDMCVSMNQVKQELGNLLNLARETGDKEMENIFKEQLGDLKTGGSRKTRNRRGRKMRGGASTLCHAITTSMFMSGGAAITYLSYLGIVPVVSKSLPKICSDGMKDQVLSAVLGVWDSSLTCAARQAKWDALRANVIQYVLGAQAFAVLSDRAIMGKSKLIEYYTKLLTWNETNVCPLIENTLSQTTKATCAIITAPFKAAMAVKRGITSNVSRMFTSKNANTSVMPPPPSKIIRSKSLAPIRTSMTSSESPEISRMAVSQGTSVMTALPGKRPVSTKSISKSVKTLKRPRSSSPSSAEPSRRRSRSNSNGSKGGRKTHRRHRKIRR